MRRLLTRVDAWCQRGDLTLEDIAWFRIIYSAGLLLILQPISQLSERSQDRFDPPPGPIRLFDAVPSPPVLEGLEIVIALLAALLLLGMHTRTVSVLLALALMTGFGLTYSFGKIDHTIVLVVAPLWMALSDWGRAMSVDAAVERSESERPGAAQWPVRFLAVTIALSFITAGWVKLQSGWLDLDHHAVQGHFARGFLKQDRTDWLAPNVMDLHLGRLWEAADWFTVALEFGLVLTLFSWRWFRLAIAITALFHVGVLLLMNIAFAWNLFGYAAFVRWSTILPWPSLGVRLRRSVGYVVAAVIGMGMYALHEWLGSDLQHDARTVLVFVGGATGAAYLAIRLARVVRPEPSVQRS